MWIAFNRSVPFEQQAVVPRVCVTRTRFMVISKTIITQDCSASGISGPDHRLAMQNTVGLIEVSRLGDIGRDQRVIHAVLSDAVNLNAKRHSDSLALQFSTEIDNGRRAPTVA